MIKNVFYPNKEEFFTSKEIILPLMNNSYSADVIRSLCRMSRDVSSRTNVCILLSSLNWISIKNFSENEASCVYFAMIQ